MLILSLLEELNGDSFVTLWNCVVNSLSCFIKNKHDSYIVKNNYIYEIL
jgi:hypothetical protein